MLPMRVRSCVPAGIEAVITSSCHARGRLVSRLNVRMYGACKHIDAIDELGTAFHDDGQKQTKRHKHHCVRITSYFDPLPSANRAAIVAKTF